MRPRWPMVLAAVASLATAEPTWHLGGPGGGGWIQAVAYSPHALETTFVGCDVGGFYRSDDGGRQWSIQNTGLRDPWVEAIVSHPTDPRILYLGTLSGVYRSDDGGRTWAPRRQGFPALSAHSYSAPIACLALDPRQPDVLYAGVGNPRHRRGGQGAIYRSADGAATWTRQSAPGALPADALPSGMVLRPDGSLLIATQHGLFASRDEGRTWTPRNAGLENLQTRRLAAAPSDPQVLYVTVASTPGKQPFDGGVYRSEDGGATWQRCVTGLHQSVRAGSPERRLTAQYDCLVVDPRDSRTVYLGGWAWVNATVYKTTDGGRTWREVLLRGTNQGPPNVDVGYLTQWGPSVECLAIHPRDPQRVIFGTSGHVIETRDGGASWQPRFTARVGEGAWTGHGLEVTCLWTLEAHPRRAGDWLLGYMDIGPWRTRDAGRSVSPATAGVAREHVSTGTAFAYDPTDPETVWAGCSQWGSNRGGLYVSQDGGSHWQPVPGLPDARLSHLVVDPTSPPAARRLWVVVTGQGVFEGVPATGAWRSVQEGLPRADVVDLGLLPGPTPGLLALVGSSNDAPGGLWTRPVAGGPWTRLDAEPFVGDPQEVVVAPSDPQRLYLANRRRMVKQQLREGGCYGSRDGGRTWTRLFDNHFIKAVAVHPANPDLVVIGGTDHPYHDEPMGCGVHYSTDGGRTWVDLTADLTLPNVSVIRFDPTDPRRLIVGTGGNSFAWRLLP